MQLEKLLRSCNYLTQKPVLPSYKNQSVEKIIEKLWLFNPLNASIALI